MSRAWKKISSLALLVFEALCMAELMTPSFHLEISSTTFSFFHLHLQIFPSDQEVKAPLLIRNHVTGLDPSRHIFISRSILFFEFARIPLKCHSSEHISGFVIFPTILHFKGVHSECEFPSTESKRLKLLCITLICIYIFWSHVKWT